MCSTGDWAPLDPPWGPAYRWCVATRQAAGRIEPLNLQLLYTYCFVYLTIKDAPNSVYQRFPE